MGTTPQEMKGLIEILAGIIHLFEIEFDEGEGRNAKAKELASEASKAPTVSKAENREKNEESSDILQIAANTEFHLESVSTLLRLNENQIRETLTKRTVIVKRKEREVFNLLSLLTFLLSILIFYGYLSSMYSIFCKSKATDELVNITI